MKEVQTCARIAGFQTGKVHVKLLSVQSILKLKVGRGGGNVGLARHQGWRWSSLDWSKQSSQGENEDGHHEMRHAMYKEGK
jgi:hypothetical protein